MAYLVLARKYRPTTFTEVIGQDHVTRTIANAFAANRVHHAFLFCGPRGCGKTTLARILGKALNCASGPTSSPCGTCSACTSIGNGSATDYQEMDGASNRGIDAIRELTEAVRYQPAVLRKKVYVIDEVHMLTTEAFNALLKTLEEPPPHVTFVLATTEPHKLPNTILSRCQRYDFKLVPASKLGVHLGNIFAKEAITIEPNAVSLVVRESGGSVRDALSLSDQIISYVGDRAITEVDVAEVLGVADRSLTRTLVRALADGDAGVALGAVESAIERGVDEVQLARAIVRYLRDLSVLQVAGDRPELIDATDEERAELAREAQAIERSRVQQMFERMLRCCDELGKTLQPRLVLDCALIDVATIEPLVPLGDLIERLGEIEARLVGPGGARASYPTNRGGGGGADKGALRMTTPGTPVGGGRAPSPPTKAPPTRTAPAPIAPPPVVTAPAPAPVVASSSGSTGSAAPVPSAAPPPSAPPALAPAAPIAVRPSGPVPAIVAEVATGSGPSTSTADALHKWDRIVEELMKKRKVVLSGYCEHARVLTWTKDELVLGYSPDFHHFGELVRDSAADVVAVVHELFDHKPKFSVRMLDGAAAADGAGRSVLEAGREKSSQERSKREAEAREHPITKHVLQTFGAQIKEIKTDV
ncbi:MAG: DNA polymerase III subunit gamma/tau [Proteobacteria bacterium]|nr:DNA polymerase III subunit gamma/tau [Pseudomonadota bacterium]